MSTSHCTMSSNSPEENTESNALRSIVGGAPSEAFFRDVWQRKCQLYRSGDELQQRPRSNETTDWNDERVQQDPFGELIRMGWPALVNLLQNARSRYQQSFRDRHQDTMTPLVFREQQIVSPEETLALYGGNLFSIFLSGCSVVLNHADWMCPYIASLCLDLQKSFPHAYANAYLTPPNSQAVNAHADDRDVLVIQVVGQKHWKVYQQVPIPYPYPHEQVGKDGLAVPQSILDGPVALEAVLKPGDVLYMPRGHVHEARTTTATTTASKLTSEPSFHVTIALPTHDWTLAGTVSAATKHILTRTLAYRKAMPLSLSMSTCWESVPETDKQLVQQQLDEAFEVLREKITLATIHDNLQYSKNQHNEQTAVYRRSCIRLAQFPDNNCEATSRGKKSSIGPEAAKLVHSPSAIVRASAIEEKESLAPPTSAHSGLNVREANADALLGVLQHLRENPGSQTRVSDMRLLINQEEEATDGSTGTELICDLTLLSFTRCCVELGAMAVVHTA